MASKADLFSRMQYLSAATRLPELVDNGIAINEHNGVANLLRKGLGIIAFNILEDYISKRAKEGLNFLSQSLLPFNNLDQKLQERSILGALEVLTFRSRLQKKAGLDWKAFIQAEALKIHSTANETYQLSDLSLDSSGSNMSSDDVKNVLQSFGITGGWQIMKTVSDSISGGIADLAEAFKNASLRRHSSAHDAEFRYDYAWLVGIQNEILSICASLDILITARCRQISGDISKNTGDHDISSALNYRFLEKKELHYKETKLIGGRTIKKWSNVPEAVTAILPRLQPNGEFLIVLDSSRRLVDWYV